MFTNIYSWEYRMFSKPELVKNVFFSAIQFNLDIHAVLIRLHFYLCLSFFFTKLGFNIFKAFPYPGITGQNWQLTKIKKIELNP